MNDLSALSSGPDLVLAPVEAVKARGDQRKQRGRVLAAGAAALVVLAGAGTAVALANGGKPDALVPAEPTPTTSTTQTGNRFGVVQMAAQALLPEREISRMTGEELHQASIGAAAQLTICGSGDPAPVAAQAELGGTLASGSGGSLVAVRVARYDTEAHARATYRQVAADLVRCPQRPDDSADGKAFSTFSALHLDDATGLVQTMRDCTTCAPLVRYWGVLTEGSWVAEVSTSRQDDVQALVDAQRERLRSCPTAESCRTAFQDDRFPLATQPREGARLWADYLWVDDTEVFLYGEEPLAKDALELGYVPSESVLGCDDGAPLAQRRTSTRTLALYFGTRAQAQAFARTWRETTANPEVTPVEVTVRCLG